LDLIHNRADVELSDYINTCANIGSDQFKAELFAPASAQQLQVARAAVKCFECGEEVHIRKQCPKGQKDNKKPKKPCPRCKRGFYWANQCQSKFDKDGNALPKQRNSKGSTRSGASQSNGSPLNQVPM
ncbi:POK9 protein, partial [Dasyornis broadbenti]|nr:POK9 protein [Dasyornis broadbenti]